VDCLAKQTIRLVASGLSARGLIDVLDRSLPRPGKHAASALPVPVGGPPQVRAELFAARVHGVQGLG
jgi:hypothetical protein